MKKLLFLGLLVLLCASIFAGSYSQTKDHTFSYSDDPVSGVMQVYAPDYYCQHSYSICAGVNVTNGSIESKAKLYHDGRYICQISKKWVGYSGSEKWACTSFASAKRNLAGYDLSYLFIPEDFASGTAKARINLYW